MDIRPPHPSLSSPRVMPRDSPVHRALISEWEAWRPRAEPGAGEDRDRAMRMLADCLARGGTHLNLRSLMLTSLPRMLPAGLQDLDIAENQLADLPDVLPPTLRSLAANHNRLTRLPDDLPPSLVSLDVAGNQLATLPDSLPPALKAIHAWGNRLTCLPANLPRTLDGLFAFNNGLTELPANLPEGLRRLNVQRNRLTRLPETLPCSIEMLDTSHNPLAELPPRLPAGLRTLNASACGLRGLPVELPAALSRMDVSDNQLTRLPAGLECLDGNASVNMSGNPMSEDTLDEIGRICDGPGYTGPRIHFSMGTGTSADVARPLPIAVSAWTADNHQAWSLIGRELDADAFALFLTRLGDTVNRGNPAFVQAVRTWLDRLAGEDSQPLRARTFELAREATTSCEDRVTLVFNQMKALCLCADIEAGAYDDRMTELLGLARGMFRLDVLEQLSRAKAGTLRFVDEIEVCLAYQVRLREALALPVDTPDMRYFNVSWVTESDLATATQQVLWRELAEFRHFLSTGWAPWRHVLERWDAVQYRQALDAVIDAMGEPFERRLAAGLAAARLPADDDEVRVRMGAEVRRDIEREIMGRLTDTCLAERLGHSLENLLQ